MKTKQSIMEKEASQVEHLFDSVVKGGYCIGCGACAAVLQSPVSMVMDSYGRLTAMAEQGLGKRESVPVAEVCPFSDDSENEDQIGERLFGKTAIYHEKLGYHTATYAGYVKEKSFRSAGSSGGMGTWIAYTMLKKGMVDGVIQVHARIPTKEDGRLFHYQVSTNESDLALGAKSKYYPIELSEVIHFIRNSEQKYLLIGIPCFIKAVRSLARIDRLISERIPYCMGLVCGHLKSSRFADMFAWQCGVEPGDLNAIDFRVKLEGYGANQYGVSVSGLVNDRITKVVSPPVNKMYGTNWGLGFFKYQACDYCDDVVAETADVTIGDAWLPQYVTDSLGTNILIVRNPLIQKILEEAFEEKKIMLDVISADDVVESQRAGFFHRREGLSYRLSLKDKQGDWRPQKRVQAKTAHLSKRIRRRFELRELLAKQSHIGFEAAVRANDFRVFQAHMDPIVEKYYQQYVPPLWRRAGSRLKQIIRKVFKKTS